MSYMEGVSRKQITLLPDSVEDYEGEENPARVIDAFVEGLDMAALGKRWFYRAERNDI